MKTAAVWKEKREFIDKKERVGSGDSNDHWHLRDQRTESSGRG